MAHERATGREGPEPASGAVTRRRFLRGVAATGAVAGLAGLPARPASGVEREIKIGYVSPRTGPLAGFGEADDFIIAGLDKRLTEGVAIGGNRHPHKQHLKERP